MGSNRFDSDPNRTNCGYTTAQKDFIRKVDGSCQMDCSRTNFCGGRQDVLTIHHLIPRFWCRLLGLDPNTLGNGITLSRTFHMWLHCSSKPNNQWNQSFDEYLRIRIAERNKRLLAGKHEEFPYYNRPLEVRKRVAKLFGGWVKLGIPRL